MTDIEHLAELACAKRRRNKISMQEALRQVISEEGTGSDDYCQILSACAKRNRVRKKRGKASAKEVARQVQSQLPLFKPLGPRATIIK